MDEGTIVAMRVEWPITYDAIRIMQRNAMDMSKVEPICDSAIQIREALKESEPYLTFVEVLDQLYADEKARDAIWNYYMQISKAPARGSRSSLLTSQDLPDGPRVVSPDPDVEAACLDALLASALLHTDKPQTQWLVGPNPSVFIFRDYLGDEIWVYHPDVQNLNRIFALGFEGEEGRMFNIVEVAGAFVAALNPERKNEGVRVIKFCDDPAPTEDLHTTSVFLVTGNDEGQLKVEQTTVVYQTP